MMDRKPVFDAFRAYMGGRLSQTEADALDEFLDRYRERDTKRHIGAKGLALIKQFEGCRLEAYPDPGTGGDPWTIGWGATGPGIRRGVTWTQAQADERLKHDLERYAAEVAAALDDAPTTQDQFDALVSFHYNTGAIARATLTKLHKAGHYADAANEFKKWSRAGGRVLPGLVRRRAAEAELYRTGAL